jgi:hypothetical protein
VAVYSILLRGRKGEGRGGEARTGEDIIGGRSGKKMLMICFQSSNPSPPPPIIAFSFL